MKNKILKIVLFLPLCLFFACEQMNEPELGVPFSKVEGINDQWILESIVQVDLLTSASQNSVDVTRIMLGDDPAEIEFSSADFTFDLDAKSSKIFLPESGSWSFDNNDFPSLINMESQGQSTSLSLLAPVRAEVDEYLYFQYTRPIGDCAVLEEGEGAVAYKYRFKRK